MRGWTKTENEIWVIKTRNKHRFQKKGTKTKAHKTDRKQNQRENKDQKAAVSFRNNSVLLLGS